MQGQVHPDRHAHLPETERRLSMQWATQVNEAYRTLKNPAAAGALPAAAGRRRDRPREQHGDVAGVPHGADGMARGGGEARAAGDHHELEKLMQRLRHGDEASDRRDRAQLDANKDYLKAPPTRCAA
jgi:molecular chaperone HscB